MPSPLPRHRLAGALLSIAGLTALLYAIIEAPTHGWTAPVTVGGFAVGVAVLAAFAWWELRSDHPMLDLRLFRNPALSAASLSIALVFFAMFGMFFALTQYLQFALGYSPLGAGLRTLPFPLTLMVLAPRSARLVERAGPRAVVTVGLATVAAGLALLSTVDLDTGYPLIAASLVAVAAGMALTSVPATTSIMASVPPGKAGVGSAVNDTTRELGGALGVAVLGSVLVSRYATVLGDALGDAAGGALAQLPDGAAAAARSSLGAALAVAAEAGGEQGAALADAARTAFVGGMSGALRIGAAVALVAALLVARHLPARAGRPAGRPSERAAPAVAVPDRRDDPAPVPEAT